MIKRISFFSLCVALISAAEGSWWWPFGGSDETNAPRMSDLLEPASILIDSAADYRDEGKFDEAVEAYRKALEELDRVEAENPDRAATTEFATVRNKRAYVNAAIDSIFLELARTNAKAVALTDTSLLERKYAEERERKEREAANARVPTPERGNAQEKPEPPRSASVNRKAAEAVLAKDPKNRKARMVVAADDFSKGDLDAAEKTVLSILEEKPNDAAAMNLKGLVEMERGETEKAEETFRQLVRSNPSRYFGYYNLAKVILKVRGDAGKDVARQLYFDHGRQYCNGPQDKFLEEALK